MAEEKIYSITEFVANLNVGLKANKAKIVGEVGEAKAGPTGHMYFTLKDSDNPAMLSCIIWAGKYKLFGIKLEPGMKIVAYGNAEIYAAYGKLSFICETIELAGEGELKKQYDELKKKLEKEGLFLPENKREIPKYPQKIGVITSKNGAVIHDFLNNVGKFGFKIKMIDSRVEGQGSVEDLLASIKTFRKKDLDVLVIIRGGGSMESLMSFNNELLVREVVGFPVPVVVGIGHDQDVPLVCLAADRSESTPTAVANLLNESWENALLLLERQEKAIFVIYREVLNDAKLLISESISIVRHSGALIARKYQEIENRIKVSFQRLKNNIINLKTKLKNHSQVYSSNFNNSLVRVKELLKNSEKIVDLNNPERNLKLGYSIATANGKIIRKTGDVKIGEDVDLKVSDGTITSTIKNIN